MKLKNELLLDPVAGDGGGDPSLIAAGGAAAGGAANGAANGGAPDWRSQIPPEFSKEPSLTGIKDIPSLVKGFVNAQKLVGADKIALPGKNATPEQMAEFYNRLGRPEIPEKYSAPENVKLADGIKIDDSRMKSTKELFHKIGLTANQGREILGFYMNSLNETEGAALNQMKAAREASVTALKTELKENYDSTLNLAKGGALKVGGEELIAALNNSGLGNDPVVIKAFAKVGQMFLEDSAHRGENSDLNITDATKAQNEISNLKQDADFWKTLNDRQAPGHREAVEKWASLHKIAFPGQTD